MGQLIGAETKLPIPYVLVQVDGLSTTSDTAGRFAIDVQANRTYKLMTRSPIHRPVSMDVSVGEDGVYDLGQIQLITAIFSSLNTLR